MDPGSGNPGTLAGEPPRVYRRLHHVRGWGYEQDEAVLPGGTGAGGQAGVRAPPSPPVVVASSDLLLANRTASYGCRFQNVRRRNRGAILDGIV
jgi:hypothetical protein